MVCKTRTACTGSAEVSLCNLRSFMYTQEEDYVHRIGRVGRAETMGLAVSLVSAHKEKVPNHYVKFAE